MKKMTLKHRFRKIIATSIIAVQCFSSFSYADMIYENTYQITVSDGIIHKNIIQTFENGVQSINLIIADMERSGVDLELLYNDVSGFMNRKTLSALTAQMPNAVAAINADFFSMSDPSYSMGPMADDGKVISSPYYDNGKMASFIMDQNQKLFIDYLKSGVVVRNETTGTSSTGYSINKHSGTYASPVIITSEYRKTSPGQSSVSSVTLTEVVIEADTVREIRTGKPGVSIPVNGYVIAASGTRGDQLASSFSAGDRLELSTSMQDSYPDLKEVAGGGTVILKDGMLAPITHKIAGRSQRTAIGITYDRKLVFMTADGRKSPYIGMTETEVADFLRTQNVRDAMMFDGGGSTEMIVNGKITNDLASERKIVNGMAIVNNRTRGSLSKLEAVLETKNIVQGDRVKLAVQGFDSSMNPVATSGITVSGNGINVEYKDGYVTFKSGGNGSIIVRSGSASAVISLNVASVNAKDPRRVDSMPAYDTAIVPDSLKDKKDVFSQAIYGVLVNNINGSAKLAVNYFNKNQELSDAIKTAKESVYKGAQYVENDSVRYVGLDTSAGISGTSGQWKSVKDALSSSNKNVVIMMSTSMNLSVSEKTVLRNLLQEASASKNIFVITKGSEYSSYAIGNVSYITLRDFSTVKAGKEEDYRYLVFKKTANGLNYGFQSLLQ